LPIGLSVSILQIGETIAGIQPYAISAGGPAKIM
jgi:hypothetical protein